MKGRKIVYKAIKETIKSAPILFFAMQINDIIYSALSVVLVHIQQYFFDSVTFFVIDNSTMDNMIRLLMFVIILQFLNQILAAISGYLPDVFMIKSNYNMKNLLFNRMEKIEPIEYENSNRLDKINKAINGVESIGEFTCGIFEIVAFQISYIIFLGIYLAKLSLVLLVILLLAFIPSFFSNIIKKNIVTKFIDESVNNRRKCIEYENCLVGKESYRETRHLGAFSLFKNKYNANFIKYKEKHLVATGKCGRIEILFGTINIICYISVISLLLYMVLNREISVGAFVAIYYAIGNLYDMMNNMLKYTLNDVISSYPYVKKYIDFLEEKCNDIKQMKNKKIEVILKDISFSYPNQEKQVLKNISLHISHGECIAIVGENGAGKTTLAKIIENIYKPTEGEVYINGKNITEEDVPGKNISAVFQNYNRYKMSFVHNVSISDMTKKDKDFIDRCKAEIGVANENEILSNEFGGIELSGGQWQKIAIRRGEYRDSDLIILDEPTASIDPQEESNMYEAFSKIVADKTSIIITHRLGVTKLADRVILMDNGRIVEDGTHLQLMKNKKKYYELYMKQSKWYII